MRPFLAFVCLQVALGSCKRNGPALADAGVTAPTEAGRTVWAAAWRETDALNLPRAGAAAAVSDGFIYVMGGVTGRSVNGDDFTASTELAQIQSDGSVGPWRPGPPMNEPRGFFDAVVNRGYLYVIGGGQGENGHILLRTVERARVLPGGGLGPWEKEQSTLNLPRRCSKAVLIDQTLFAIGGFGGDMLNTVEHATFLPDGGLDEWFEEDGKLTVLRYISGVKHVGGVTYVVGGHHQEEGVGIKDVELARVIDTAGYGKWRKTAPLLVGRYGLAVAAHGGKLYALGGISGAEYLDSIEAASIRADGELEGWRPLSTKLWSKRALFDVQVYQDWIYVIGGTSRSGYTGSVEYATFSKAGELGSWVTQEEDDTWKRDLARQATEVEQPLANEGVVVKTMNAKQYVYLLVKGKAGEAWLAAPRAEYKLGEQVAFGEGVLMQDFFSKELGSSFPTVLFVGEVRRLPGAPR